MTTPTSEEVETFFNETEAHLNVIDISGEPFTVELIYQMFRARLYSEVKAELLSTVKDLREVCDDGFAGLIDALEPEKKYEDSDIEKYL